MLLLPILLSYLDKASVVDIQPISQASRDAQWAHGQKCPNTCDTMNDTQCTRHNSVYILCFPIKKKKKSTSIYTIH